MSAQVKCPYCESILEHGSAATPLTHCTACGSRLLCPRCGSVLSRDPAAGPGIRCPTCRVSANGTDTGAAFTTPGDVEDQPVSVPGFEILAEVGRGGMGIVYRARQLSLDREVAIKVLPPALAADAGRLERFRNEAALAGGLVDAHILPIFDVRQAQGVPVIVMPLIDGSDLGRILRERRAEHAGRRPPHAHPWALLDDRGYLEKVFPVLDGLVEAAAVLHRRGILHRDIKPSNLLVDSSGRPWLGDFGLARLEDQGVGTQAGMGIGTPGYRSPEQVAGERPVDFRADVFSLGVTLYQALTLEMPYRGEARADATPPRPASRRQPLLTRGIDAVLARAVDIDPGRRYANATEFQADWTRARQGTRTSARCPGLGDRFLSGARRHRSVAAVCLTAAVLLAGLAAALAPWHSPSPGSPVSTAVRTVVIETEPPGARVAIVPLDPDYGYPAGETYRPTDNTPVTVEGVPVGPCLVVAEVPGRGFHEVYRQVPDRGELCDFKHPQRQWENLDGDRVRLAKVTIPAATVSRGMARFEGGKFTAGALGVDQFPSHERQLEPFYLDCTEVKAGDYRSVFQEIKNQAVGEHEALPENFAAGYVSFDWAVDYAERVGKRLPDEFEYEFAATGGGQHRFPWGDDPGKIKSWSLGKVREADYDRTDTDPPVYGLFSNVAEWTTSGNMPYPGSRWNIEVDWHSAESRRRFGFTRIVRGTPPQVLLETPKAEIPPALSLEWDPRNRLGYSRDKVLRGLGFRCARSARPRFLEDH